MSPLVCEITIQYMYIYKKKEIFLVFRFLFHKWAEGEGGQSLGNMSPKKPSFFRPSLIVWLFVCLFVYMFSIISLPRTLRNITPNIYVKMKCLLATQWVAWNIIILEITVFSTWVTCLMIRAVIGGIFARQGFNYRCFKGFMNY